MALGLYSEQGTAEEIVGRVVGLHQRKFMAKYRQPSTPTPTSPAHHEVLEDVSFTPAEIHAGRSINRAQHQNYVDPSLHAPVEDHASDTDLDDWLWSLMKTMRAGNDNDKLYPPGTVREIQSYTVFISGDASKTGGKAKYSRKEGRRIVLRAVDDVEARFGEPVFGRSSESPAFPAALHDD